MRLHVYPESFSLSGPRGVLWVMGRREVRDGVTWCGRFWSFRRHNGTDAHVYVLGPLFWAVW